MWDDTMALMTWKCPGYLHLFYKLLTNHSGKYSAHATRGIPVAATDARNIMINPDTFFKYSLPERVFIVGHEIQHNIYGDVGFLNRCRDAGEVPMDDGSKLPFDEKSMQHAMDYRINALLKESNIGKAPEGALLDDEMATANDGICDVYRKVYQDYEKNGNLGGNPGGFDMVLIPGASTGQNPQAAQGNPQQWAVEIKQAAALEAMRSQGKMAGALQRMFEQVLNPQIPWTDKIRGIFNRKVGSGGYNWRRPDRRFITRDIYFPSRSGNGAGHVVVWGDTSGSIGDSELCHYLAELSSIVEECQPKRLTVLWCDAHIHRVDEIEEPGDMAQLQYDAANEGVGGGGGTSCDPCFEWMAQLEEKPEVFIGFTDGYVTFPHKEPDGITVIWASVAKEADGYPWGDVVKINTRAA